MYEKKLWVVSAALPSPSDSSPSDSSPSDSSPSGFHRDHTTSQSAPTSDHEDEEVEQFYDRLDSTIAKTPKKDIVVVQGDLNAQSRP